MNTYAHQTGCEQISSVTMTVNPALNRTARKLRLRVPSSLRSSAAG